jgi:uroporphyrinogen decarboxylase
MNSRERIQEAFNFRQTDKVPIDFGGHRSSGINVMTYKKLREYLGLKPGNLYIYDLIQQLAIIEDDVLDIVGSDTVELGHDYYKDESYWQDWELQDGTPCKIPAFIKVEKINEGSIVRGDEGQPICIQKQGCLYFEQTYFPLIGKDDESFDNLQYDLNQIMWFKMGTAPAPTKFDEVGLKIWGKTAFELRNSTDRAIYGSFGGNLFESGQFAFGMENFLCELIENPKRAHKFLDKMTEFHLENMDKYLSAVGDKIDVIGFGDDFGTQNGPQISPDMYREFFKPRQKILWNHAKKLYPKLKVGLHCCGGVYPLLKDMIEAGLDAINPVQLTCKDMELTHLKKEFGKDLVFWGGGCDTREILPFGTPEQVKKHVKENIKIMNKDGGFVFQQVHNIMAGVPPQNIMAMFEAVREV